MFVSRIVPMSMGSQEPISGEAIEVLACLPRAPAAAVISEIAQDVFDLEPDAAYALRRRACGRVRRALDEIGRRVRIYREYRLYGEDGRPVPWGQRERYGVAENDWPMALAMMSDVAAREVRRLWR